MTTIYKTTILSFLALATLIPSQAQINYFNPVSQAQNYNVFVQNDFTAKGGDSHGPVAIGGNLYLDGNGTTFTMNAGSENNTNGIGLLINGRIYYISGSGSTVNNGNIRLGNSAGSDVYYLDNNNVAGNLRITPSGTGYNGAPHLLSNHVQSQTTNNVSASTGINFTTSFNSLSNFNNAINDYSNSSIPCASYVNYITISCSNNQSCNPNLTLVANKLNYVDLTISQFQNLASVGSITFSPSPDATHLLIFNIHGTGSASSVTWPSVNVNGISHTEGAYVLYNFTNVGTIYNTSNEVDGTILAPGADFIRGSNGNDIYGQVITKSLSWGTGELEYYNYAGQIPSCGTGFNSNVPLAQDDIHLSAFINKNNTVSLSWNTANEATIAEYTVEKSTDAISFSTLSAIAKNNTGTYNTIDNAPLSQTTYYRIAAKQQNGTKKYSDLATLSVKANGNIHISPNPFKDHLDIAFQTEQPSTAYWQMSDITGKIIAKGALFTEQGVNSYTLRDVNNLSKGIYFFKLYTDDGTIMFDQKILKD